MDNNWINKFRHKLSSFLIRDHLPWEEWKIIWQSLFIKEKIAETSWWEYSCGANSQGQLFQRQHFGQKNNLSKITIEWLKKPYDSLHVFKRQQELCSTSTSTVADFPRFWMELKRQSYDRASKQVEEKLQTAGLKLLGDNPQDAIETEQKVFQWLNASLLVLKNAILQSTQTQNQFLTARIAIGMLPLQDHFQIQIHCFNLEINFMSQNGKVWQLLVFDHKDGSNKDLKPSLSSTVEIQAKNIWGQLSQVIQEIVKN